MNRNGESVLIDSQLPTVGEGAPSSGQGPNDLPTTSTLSKMVSRLAELAPRGPLGAHQGIRAEAAKRGVWAVDELSHNKVCVAIPRNLESWGDDFQAIAACAAIEVLNGTELVNSTEDWPLNQRINDTNRSAGQYFAGVAHALRYAPTTPYTEFSGAFGHGYSWIGHLWMEANQVQGWLVRGTAKTPSQVLMQSAWGQGMPQELRRLEALLRRAARALPLEGKAHTWCRTKAQLLGHGIKASLPWMKVGVLSESEANWIASRYEKEAQAFNEMLASLEPANISLDVMQAIPAKNTAIANSLRGASSMVDSAIRGRFVALTKGLSRRQAQVESKRPIRDRLAQMDMECRLSVFHPLYLRNRQFRLPEQLLIGLERGDPQAYADALADALAFCTPERDPELRVLAETWFRQSLVI